MFIIAQFMGECKALHTIFAHTVQEIAKKYSVPEENFSQTDKLIYFCAPNMVYYYRIAFLGERA